MSPYQIAGPALISFSGGRTSGYMLRKILEAHGGRLPADVVVGFANTGKERRETLDFVRDCGEHWDVPVVWLEWRDGEAMPHCSTRSSARVCCRSAFSTNSRIATSAAPIRSRARTSRNWPGCAAMDRRRIRVISPVVVQMLLDQGLTVLEIARRLEGHAAQVSVGYRRRDGARR